MKRGTLNHRKRKDYSTDHVETLVSLLAKEGPPNLPLNSQWLTPKDTCTQMHTPKYTHTHTQAKKSNCIHTKKKKLAEYLITGGEGTLRVM